MITNFDELLCNAEQILSKRSLSPVTVDQYLAGMRQIFKIARALGHQSCSHEFLMHYLQTRENYYLFSCVGKARIQALYRTVGLIVNTMAGDFSKCLNPFDFELYRTTVTSNIDRLSVDGQQAIREFVAHLASRQVSESCIKSYKYRTALFLTLLQKSSPKELASVSPQEIIDALSKFCVREKNGFSKSLYGPKLFFKWLFDIGVLDKNLSVLFRVKAPRHYPEVKSFSSEEITKLLAALDKADYNESLLFTFISLIQSTGLRKTDAINLTVQQIDWAGRKISICQSKTGRAVQLPLTDSLAAVLSWFLLHRRPTLAQQYVFVDDFRPYAAKTAPALNRQFAKLKRRVLGHRYYGYGFHAIRRSVGTRLHEKETPNYLITEILGHTSLQSVRPYIRTDLEHLRECCLPISLIGG